MINKKIIDKTLHSESITILKNNYANQLIDTEYQTKIDSLPKSEIDKYNNLKMINYQKLEKDKILKELRQKQIADEYLKNRETVENTKLKLIKDDKIPENFKNIDFLMDRHTKKKNLDDLERSIIKDQLKSIDLSVLNSKKDIVNKIKDNKQYVKYAFENFKNELNRSIQLEKDKRRNNMSLLYMHEVENVRKIIETKDNIDLQKQIGMQIKVNQQNSMIISTKLNKIGTITNNKNLKLKQELDSQEKHENFYKLNIKNQERKN